MYGCKRDKTEEKEEKPIKVEADYLHEKYNNSTVLSPDQSNSI